MSEVNPTAWRLGSLQIIKFGDVVYTYTKYNATVELWEKNLAQSFGPVEALYSQETVDELQNQISSIARTGRGMMETVNNALARAAAAEEEIARLRKVINSDFPHQHIYKEAIHTYADGYETGWTNAMAHCRQALLADNSKLNQDEEQ
jgi:hypothetical protein